MYVFKIADKAAFRKSLKYYIMSGSVGIINDRDAYLLDITSFMIITSTSERRRRLQKVRERRKKN